MATDNEYVVVTCISTHRMRYVVPMDELQKLNEDYIVDPKWALDCVTCEEVGEFSQMHIGEQIIDHVVMNEEEILNLFDNDNDYLKNWDKEYKLAWIRNWKENPSEKEKAEFEKIRAKHMVSMEETNRKFMEALDKSVTTTT